MEQVNWGILGCGDVTEVKSGPAFNKVTHSKIEAVMRRNADKAADYAKRHQIEKWYSQADELINDSKINAIYIATPPAPHKTYAIQSLEAGKPVYIEKPVTITVADAEELLQVQKNTSQKITVAHYRRALPLFLQLKEWISKEVIGEIRLIDLKLFQKLGSDKIAKTEENWRVNPEISGGGLFYDLAPHQLDILVFLFGKPIYYSGFSLNQEKNHQASDFTCGQALFQNNIPFQGVWNFNSHPENEVEKCEIIGSKGKIDFAFFGNQASLTVEGKTITMEFENPKHIQQNMIEKTVNYFLDKGENPCSLEDAIISLQIIETFGKSLS